MSGNGFSSDWAAGDVQDGGVWSNYDDRGVDGPLLTVLKGFGPGGLNALAIQQRGERSANIWRTIDIPPSKDFRVSFWLRNDDTSAAGDHTVTCDIYKYTNLTYVRKFSTATDWNFVISAFLNPDVYVWPIGYWGPKGLTHGVWYRLEFDVHFVDATHVQIRPRVYSPSGTLLLEAKDFIQSNPGNPWMGKSDWNLDTFYKAGNVFTIDPVALNTFGLGNNGQRGATDTKAFWYVAGVNITPLLDAPLLTSGTYSLPGGALVVVP